MALATARWILADLPPGTRWMTRLTDIPVTFGLSRRPTAAIDNLRLSSSRLISLGVMAFLE